MANVLREFFVETADFSAIYAMANDMIKLFWDPQDFSAIYAMANNPAWLIT